MPLLSLLLILIVVGVVIFAVTTYIPMDPGIKRLIQIVGVIVCVVIILNAFGVIGSMSNVTVPRIR